LGVFKGLRQSQTIFSLFERAERYLIELRESLKSGTYRPMPVKRVDIPKGPGQTRPLGIPSVKDRIVQTALKMAIEPIFETSFRKGSYGFRPGRGCKDALREVDRLLKEGYTHVVDADLKSYFDTIPYDRLMARVEKKISDGRVLDPIEGYLGQDIMRGTERWTRIRRRKTPVLRRAMGGHAAGGGHLSAVGQHLSASARPPDGAGRIQNGSLRRRLRDLVPERERSQGSVAPRGGVDGSQRLDAASGKDAHRRRARTGPGLRLPGSGLARPPSDYEEVASCLGAGPAYRLRRVTLPLTAPYLFAAFRLSFALSMGELGATIMVYPSGWVTMPVAIFGLTDRGDIFSVAGLTMILVVTALALLLGLERAPIRSAAPR
jgi:hypothetical protein